jgi:hypothetical protein
VSEIKATNFGEVFTCREHNENGRVIL